MSRPQKEGMDYFPHDTDASSDGEKVEVLLSLHGTEGYTFYFILLERIYRTSNFELDISDAETRQILSRKITITLQKFDEILITALKYGCFDRELYEKRGVLTSNGVKKRSSVVVEKRVKMRSYSKLGVSDAETQQKPSRNLAETPQSKVKKSKEKESNYTVEFENFWNLYPRKKEKQSAFKNWNTRLSEKHLSADLILAAKNYAKECNGKEEQYIKLAATFLGPNKPFEDWVEVKKQNNERYQELTDEDLPEYDILR